MLSTTAVRAPFTGGIPLSRRSNAGPIAVAGAIFRLLVPSVLLAILVWGTMSASAIANQELAGFNAMVAAALRHYQAASFYLRTRNPEVAAFELKLLQDGWQAVVARYAGSPPGAFAADPQWRDTLVQVSSGINQAFAAANAGDVESSQARLRGVYQELTALRKRNFVQIFSDNVDELNAAVARLGIHAHGALDLRRADQVNAIKAAAAVVAYLAEKCRNAGSPEYQQNEEFRRLIAGILESLEELVGALDRKDEQAVRTSIGTIRSYDRMLSLRFG